MQDPYVDSEVYRGMLADRRLASLMKVCIQSIRNAFNSPTTGQSIQLILYVYLLFVFTQLYDRICCSVVSPTRAPPGDSVIRCRDVVEAVLASPSHVYGRDRHDLVKLLTSSHIQVSYFFFPFLSIRRVNSVFTQHAFIQLINIQLTVCFCIVFERDPHIGCGDISGIIIPFFQQQPILSYSKLANFFCMHNLYASYVCLSVCV